MTGRIEVLAAANKPGRIVTTSGVGQFHYTYQLPLGRVDGLAEGRLVTFELEKSQPQMAVSVCVKGGEPPQLSPNAPCEIRYSGFEQTKNVRTYKFLAWQRGEENQEALVTVDLALLRKHGITLQEGPALCMRFVQAELQQPSPSESVWTRTLTDEQISAHLALRAISSKKR